MWILIKVNYGYLWDKSHRHQVYFANIKMLVKVSNSNGGIQIWYILNGWNWTVIVFNLRWNHWTLCLGILYDKSQPVGVYISGLKDFNWSTVNGYLQMWYNLQSIQLVKYMFGFSFFFVRSRSFNQSSGFTCTWVLMHFIRGS